MSLASAAFVRRESKTKGRITGKQLVRHWTRAAAISLFVDLRRGLDSALVPECPPALQLRDKTSFQNDQGNHNTLDDSLIQ
jgi:hypothetical protein